MRNPRPWLAGIIIGNCTRRGGTIPLAAIVEDYQRELDDEQARYDRQTGFGTNARTQWTWTSQTRKALESR
jgi:hypothetical protein